MGFKLGGESTSNIQENEQIISSNTKSDVVEKQINEEICISSSEIDEEKNLKLLNLCDDESLHYQSEKEKIYEESGTEDKREDIKLNFNSIFGYHSNVKIITNDEKDQIEEENTEKEENNFGGLYFNEKFFTNFDKVFKIISILNHILFQNKICSFRKMVIEMIQSEFFILNNLPKKRIFNVFPFD
jgi:hypothetical protein